MLKYEYNEIPLPIIKLLCEKSIDKRILGHKELENFMKQVTDIKNDETIIIFIKNFRSHLYDQGGIANYNVTLRKASFSGFLIISNYLKSLDYFNSSSIYLLIQPLILSFKDNDSKMIVDAANTLIKILRNHNRVVMKYFNEIFEGLLSMNVHIDQEVRNAANSLDELLKEIMNNYLETIESINPQEFNVNDLFNKLFEKIRANHPSIKILIVSWVTFLDSIKEIKLINFLPEILPGIFLMLSDKIKDVNQSAEKSLNHFLNEIDNNFENYIINSSIVLNKLLEIILDQCKIINEQGKIQITAFNWLLIFLQKYLSILSNFYSKSVNSVNKIQSAFYNKLRSSNAAAKYKEKKLRVQIANKSDEQMTLSSVNKNDLVQDLPFNKLNTGNNNNSNPDGNNNYNDQISKIPFNLFHRILDSILLNVDSQNEQILSLSIKCNFTLSQIIDYLSLETNTTINIKQFEEVLKNYFNSKKESTIDLILNWVSKLFKNFREDMFTKVDVFIDNFTNILSDSNENIFNSILDILCEISINKEEYTELILCKILEKLSFNKNLLNSKGLIILKKLSSVLPVERVYIKFADVLIKMKDYEFISHTLNILDIFLITYKETEPVRHMLKKYHSTNEEGVKAIFEKIFTAWSFNPISTLSLCIVSEYFTLSYHLILKFGELKMEQEYLIQLSQLVQLIESSIFNNVRVLLLEPIKNIYLVKTLYGILMILPQGKAYQALSKRMKSIEMLLQIDNDISKNNYPQKINQEEIEHYLTIFINTHLMLKTNRINII